MWDGKNGGMHPEQDPEKIKRESLLYRAQSKTQTISSDQEHEYIFTSAMI